MCPGECARVGPGRPGRPSPDVSDEASTPSPTPGASCRNRRRSRWRRGTAPSLREPSVLRSWARLSSVCSSMDCASTTVPTPANATTTAGWFHEPWLGTGGRTVGPARRGRSGHPVTGVSRVRGHERSHGVERSVDQPVGDGALGSPGSARAGAARSGAVSGDGQGGPSTPWAVVPWVVVLGCAAGGVGGTPGTARGRPGVARQGTRSAVASRLAATPGRARIEAVFERHRGRAERGALPRPRPTVTTVRTTSPRPRRHVHETRPEETDQ